MAALRDLKEQIDSVDSTAQITEAMQLVSASRMQKAQDRVENARPYIEGIYEMINKLGKITDYESLYLKKPKNIKNVAFVVVGTGRGFVGNLLANITSEVFKNAEKIRKTNKDIKIHGISIHKTGQKILTNAGVDNSYHFAKYIDNPTTTELTSIYQLLVDNFENNKFDEIYLIYTQFVNTVLQIPKIKKVLPISIEELTDNKNQNENTIKKEFKFEPNPKSILDSLLPEYFQSQIYLGLLESIASEHSARMVAMQNATDNSKELKKKLELKYNRQRQANITQEIIEVINGSA